MAAHLSDYHTHTTYCDGKSSAFEMARAAYELGFTHYGFSGHGYTDFDPSYCMSPDSTLLYQRDVMAIKEMYEGKMEVLLGLEQDMLHGTPLIKPDYIIGSAHYLKRGERFFPIDTKIERFSEYLRELFDGNYEAMAEEYFKGLEELLERVDADIIGHFDLITKYRERLGLPLTDAFYEAALKTVDRLLSYHKPFEVNVGAITRGYRSSPYPDPIILKRIFEGGGEIIITGDTHSAENLGKNLDLGIKAARDAGFTERVILTKDGKRLIAL